MILYFFGPPGVDRAAHVYHTTQFEQHGWRVWNNYWYAGRYELLNYSILFYPMAAIAGIGTVVLASLAAGTALFARSCRACRCAAAACGPRWRSRSRGPPRWSPASTRSCSARRFAMAAILR